MGRKLIYGFFVTVLLTACASNGTVDSKQLAGKYDVDMQPMLNAAADEHINDENKEVMEFGKSLASTLLETIDFKINFYENGQCVIEANSVAMMMLSNYADFDVDKINQFKYKIKQDSVLYIQQSNQTDYLRVGVIRKIADNYDYLQLVGDDFCFNLIKLKE